ncbi:uncharacterized protein LOC120285016 [Drosophila simulans]|uniref:uncharacterized protein LOC120284845 n=1 Tax=Drosophila simulans TaxID=7240 RepID=UPI00192CE842|nr:uncharacterized protein LOC120284845 [Drosophila simulans]XP_039150472.1 uncharacterized protein LOC120284939 [Drosophila simulans]XP_039151105.1 uncharacterized protein LOC120285016 [Drosophila simulans]
MASKITIVVSDFENSNIPQQMGRRNLSYQNAGERLKRKLASNLASESDHDTSLLIHAATVSARKECKRDVAFVLKETLKTPEFPSESRMQIQCQKPTPLSPDEALAYLLENTLTKQQYISTRLLNKSHNSDIYPPYNEVIEAKLQCRPEGIEVMENTAQVLLQNLLDHTAQRLIKLQSDVFKEFPDIFKIKLICSYGFDGTTGHSAYKQKYETEALGTPISDQSLFVTSVIPIQIIDSFNRHIWINRAPQSIRFCRPLKIELIKETAVHIMMEKNQLDNQIKNLTPFTYKYDENRDIEVSYEMHMTLIDGKVLNVLTDTKSTQCCPICGVSPTQMLKISNFSSETFVPKVKALQFGS